MQIQTEGKISALKTIVMSLIIGTTLGLIFFLYFDDLYQRRVIADTTKTLENSISLDKGLISIMSNLTAESDYKYVKKYVYYRN